MKQNSLLSALLGVRGPIQATARKETHARAWSCMARNIVEVELGRHTADLNLAPEA